MPADTDQPTLAVTTTGRGFAVARGVDLYGQPWSIQDSSLATQAAIWLGGDDNARAHLTQDQAADLLPLLKRFVDTGTIAPQEDTRTNSEPRPAGDLREAVLVETRDVHNGYVHPSEVPAAAGLRDEGAHEPCPH